jgi:hypothetical protein
MWIWRFLSACQCQSKDTGVDHPVGDEEQGGWHGNANALAVVRLTLVGACTGGSAGFSPLRMRSM